MSIVRSSIFIEMRPSCGMRRSEISSRARILKRDASGKLQLLRQLGFDKKHAVDSQPQDDASFLRLDMNVAGAFLDRQRQNVICQTNDGSVFGCGGQIRRVRFFFFFLLNLEAAEDFVLKLFEALQLKFAERSLSSVFFSPFALLFSPVVSTLF